VTVNPRREPGSSPSQWNGRVTRGVGLSCGAGSMGWPSAVRKPPSAGRVALKVPVSRGSSSSGGSFVGRRRFIDGVFICGNALLCLPDKLLDHGLTDVVYKDVC